MGLIHDLDSNVMINSFMHNCSEDSFMQYKYWKSILLHEYDMNIGEEHDTSSQCA